MQAVTREKQARVKSAERVLDILEVLSQEPKGLGFTELLHTLSLPKSSLHELLSVLTERGYLELDPTSRTYTLGIRVWESGQAYLRHHDLVREALPVMDSIVRAINETVQLAILDGIENVYLAKADSSHPLRLQSEVGRRLYAHATGLGKALLAYLPEEDLLARLEGRTLPRFTPNTITEASQLLRELATIRERGFAVDAQEYTPGVSCVAVPIWYYPGRVIAAMSVSIPVTRADAELFASALGLLAEGSLKLSRRLGYVKDDVRLASLPEQSGAIGKAIVARVARGSDAVFD
jgi:DNA-binding IclR family transcriptional regulator